MTRTSQSKAKETSKPYERTAVEEAAVSANLDRRRRRIRAPRVKSEGVKGGKVQLAADHPDPLVWQAALEQTFGTVSYDAASLLVASALGLAQPDPKEVDSEALNAVLGLIHGINPADEIEGMLATQMVGLHLASVQCMRRA